MFSKKKKKEGFTLVELIVSLAIISIMIIPTMNMIVTSTKNIQKAKQREQAELIGKEVIEEIKAISLSELAAPLSTKTLSSGIILTKKDDTTISAEGTIEDKYEVKVILAKKDDIGYIEDNRNFDAEYNVYINESNKLIIEKTDGTNSTEVMLSGDVNITIENNESTIKILDKVINKTLTVSDTDTRKTGYLRINLLEETVPRNIEFTIQNNMDSEFNLCISRSKETKFTSSEKITDVSKGSVIITKQEFTPDEMGDIYELNVIITKKGENNVLFTGKGYKNISFKK